jgi:hypothetical protein
VRGNIHDATLFSPPQPSQRKPSSPLVAHLRRPVSGLTEASVADIVDGAVRAAVQSRLVELGITDPKKAFADPANHPFLVTRAGTRVPIHRVRLEIKRTVRPVGVGPAARHVASAENHHVAFYESTDRAGNATLRASVVTLLDALLRKKEKLPVVLRQDSTGAPLRFFLQKGDTICVQENGQSPDYWIVDSFSPLGKEGVDMEFSRHSDARTKIERKKLPGARLRRTSNSFFLNAQVRPVEVDPLGTVTPRSC